ncbi:MAG: hypothetical protein HGA60_01705 [Chlorobiaceae bacterium]|nr:hypothetical protein [Chlorobiaceae bacterium]
MIQELRPALFRRSPTITRVARFIWGVIFITVVYRLATHAMITVKKGLLAHAFKAVQRKIATPATMIRANSMPITHKTTAYSEKSTSYIGYHRKPSAL